LIESEPFFENTGLLSLLSVELIRYQTPRSSPSASVCAATERADWIRSWFGLRLSKSGAENSYFFQFAALVRVGTS